ncbi:hypothetical protein LJK88_02970 [Paenibacillus sp. P26]|nr:hypothetical protein LJK88_02970 [Paenibacillus sp. P26]
MRILYDEMDSPIGPLVLASSGTEAGQGLCHIEFGRFDEAADKLVSWSERWYGVRDWRGIRRRWRTYPFSSAPILTGSCAASTSLWICRVPRSSGGSGKP